MRSFPLAFLHIFKNRGLQVLVILSLYLLLAHHLPLSIHQSFYTFSLLIKDLLVWMLPLTIGLFIADTICSFERKAPLFIVCLLLFEAVSNLSSVWYAFVSGHLASEYLPMLQISKIHDEFSALWRLPFIKPSWWAADKGMMVGLCFGFWGAMSKKLFFKQLIHRGKETAEWILTRFFSRLIPFFILGFVARMWQTDLLQQVLFHYGELLMWLAFFLVFYLVFLFFISSGFSFSHLLSNIKNLLPAGSLAFSSGCSLSTMPWTIEGTAKNLKNPGFAKAVIPATTNIQQIGDCITNTFLCFLIYRHFYGHNPDLMTWIHFSLVFVLARFTTAAVLGGAIFIMLPIYESYLSFNTEMIAIILAFNILLDPIITSCNVMANGALCRVFERVWMLFSQKEKNHLKEKGELPSA